MENDKAKRTSFRFILFLIVGIIVYAYGFEVTEVDLDAFRDPNRQESRVRVTRALVKPDILEYEQEVFIQYGPVYVPCQGVELPEPDKSGAYLIFEPDCASPGEEILVKGFNFPPNSEGPVSFIPSTDPEFNLALTPERVKVDSDGSFEVVYEMPERPNNEEYQLIRATVRRNVGTPSFSEMAKDTWDKIIETIFLALLATTIGTALSIPISFFAARNLMRDVKSPLSSIALSFLGWPLGIGLGVGIFLLVGFVGDFLSANLAFNLGGFAVSTGLTYFMARGIFSTEEQSDSQNRLLQTLRNLVLATLAFISMYLFANLFIVIGQALTGSLGIFDFFANFIYQLGDVLKTLTPVFAVLVGGAMISGLMGRFGQNLSETMESAPLRVINAIAAAISFGTLVIILGFVIDWLYEIENFTATMWIPGGIAAAVAIVFALSRNPKEPLPIGTTIYAIARTLLNATRSVEPVIMGIVFVIWVGIGPFAGVLALALHTVAALSKLYSEQVESISEGPIEAITATGANRLQMIVYGVIPQIIPPYISFTMYRWDINVRMSTIIGLVGGGGIGTLLIQNINMLNYQGASVQMIAIAIVVATMDYVSSTLRERFV